MWMRVKDICQVDSFACRFVINMQRLASIGSSIALYVILSVSCSDSTRIDLPVTHSVVSNTYEHLFQPNSSKFEKAQILRRLVADTLDVGFTSDSLCLNFHKIGFQEFNVDSFLSKFANNTGTGKCGLAASILTKLLNNHGIEAYTYNYGFENSRLTHVVVLANTDSNSWTLHDPFFNYSITDLAGNPKDFFKMVEELKNNHDSDIAFSTDTVLRQVFLIEDMEIPDFVSQSCRQHLKSELEFNNDSLVVTKPVCQTCTFDTSFCSELNLFHNLALRVKELDYPGNPVYGLLFQINGVWGPSPDTMQRKIDMALPERR